MTTSNLLSTPEVAAQLGVSASTVLRLARAGTLKPAHKASGKTGALLFRPSAVERYRAKHATDEPLTEAGSVQ